MRYARTSPLAPGHQHLKSAYQRLPRGRLRSAPAATQMLLLPQRLTVRVPWGCTEERATRLLADNLSVLQRQQFDESGSFETAEYGTGSRYRIRYVRHC